MDYLKYFAQERFLFEDVQQRFAKSGKISTFDFHCILVWKANRAKNMHIERLCRGGLSYKNAGSNLISELVRKKSPKERLEWMMKGPGLFRLPTATAVLTVLYPSEFTVYDVRVCDQLGRFHSLKDRKFTDKLWDEYEAFKQLVVEAVPGGYSLRDKDRYLWGKSVYEQICHEWEDA